MKTLGLIGTGNIGAALVRSLAREGTFTLLLNDIDEAVSRSLAEETESRSVSLDDLLDQSDLVVLAVKPQVLPSLYPRLRTAPGMPWISTAAGIPLDTLCRQLASEEVARIMPNLAASIGQSVTALAFSSGAGEDFRADVLRVVTSFGSCLPLDEGLFGAFTALSGSAIATVFQFANGLAMGGVREGFSYPDALRIVNETLLGAAALLQQSGVHPEALASRVCSPAGTAIETLALLENRNFKGILIESIRAATRRSKELESASNGENPGAVKQQPGQKPGTGLQP